MFNKSPARKSDISILIFCAAALFISCGASAIGDISNYTARRRTSFDYFGTVCFISVYDDFSNPKALSRLDTAWEEILSMLSELEAAASFDRADSDIGRFNSARSGERVAIRPLTAGIIAKAIEMHRFTGGAYNPAVADLVDLWGFSPRFRKEAGQTMPYDRPRNPEGGFELPPRKYVEAFKALADLSLLSLEGNESSGYYLKKNAPDIEVEGILYSQKIDLGGIAKGWGVQRAAEILMRHGYEYGYASLGMSSMSLLKRTLSDTGAKAANMWAVGVSDPDQPSQTALEIFAKDLSLSTSGAYDLRYSVGGRIYGHIIDAKTGEPSRGEVLSATVLGKDAAFADAISTALCVMDRESALAFMKQRLSEYKVALLLRGSETGIELATNIPPKEYLWTERE